MCLTCGLEGNNALGHEASEASCVQNSKCRRCGVVLELAIGHDFDEATFLAPKRCVRCQATEGVAGYESFIAAVSELKPYADEVGSLSYRLNLTSSEAATALVVKRVSEVYREFSPHCQKIISICEKYPELQTCKSVAAQILGEIEALNISGSTDLRLLISDLEQLKSLTQLISRFYKEAARALESAAVSL